METFYEMRNEEFSLSNELYLLIRISAEKYIVEDTTVFFYLFVCLFLTYIRLRHAHKSSSEFFWSTKCELEIIFMFSAAKRARGLLPEPATRSEGL